jgi:hypothetical protein
MLNPLLMPNQKQMLQLHQQLQLQKLMLPRNE